MIASASRYFGSVLVLEVRQARAEFRPVEADHDPGLAPKLLNGEPSSCQIHGGPTSSTEPRQLRPRQRTPAADALRVGAVVGGVVGRVEVDPGDDAIQLVSALSFTSWWPARSTCTSLLAMRTPGVCRLDFGRARRRRNERIALRQSSMYAALKVRSRSGASTSFFAPSLPKSWHSRQCRLKTG